MVNPEEVLQSLDEFSKLKPKDIPRELEEYLLYVAKTGDPVYQWSLVKCLFREKMLNVITDFYESCRTIDLPPCPNVDPFNYETMKASLLERLDSFSNAPFTVQRLCELLTTPRKEYTRVDKFMRAIEKNILVVSTKEPGGSRARADVATQPQQPTPQQQQQPDVLMNGVMDGRGGAGGLDIGEAIETVSTEGVNLMHGTEASAESADVALADSIRVECEDIEMDDGGAAVAAATVWDPKPTECSLAADGLKTMAATPDPAPANPDDEVASASSAAPAPTATSSVVWESKAEECTVNGDVVKPMAAEPEASTATAVVWDTKTTECRDGLKALSPSPERETVSSPVPEAAPAPKPSEDDPEAAAVAVVSEFLAPSREVFGQPPEEAAAAEAAPLALETDPDPVQGATAGCADEEAAREASPTITETVAEEQERTEQERQLPAQQPGEEESKEVAESKEPESEEVSQTDGESGISCSADSSSTSLDCATAEMNQTLETNGSLEITSVESEVMSPLEGLEDVTANISPPSPDRCISDDSREATAATTPPPTFAEMTADEDTQDAVRSSEPLDDDIDDDEEESELKVDSGTKTESEAEPAIQEETSMEVDEVPVVDNAPSEELVTEQTVMEAVELQAQSSQDETTTEQPVPSAEPFGTV